jgi:hypothetical protein
LLTGGKLHLTYSSDCCCAPPECAKRTSRWIPCSFPDTDHSCFRTFEADFAVYMARSEAQEQTNNRAQYKLGIRKMVQNNINLVSTPTHGGGMHVKCGVFAIPALWMWML